MQAKFDAIVVGSGIGGLAAAAALGRANRRVLVLERHRQPGGLTQTFERDGFRFNIGVHYLGGFGLGQPVQRVFEALVGDRLKMAPIPGAFDRLNFPGLRIALDGAGTRGEGAAILAAFPHEREGLARYAESLALGERALQTMLYAHCAPPLAGSALEWLRHGAIERWVGRTTQDVVNECVSSPQARAALCARWGDYGSPPAESSFALHATVMRSYRDGAWYPVGGAGQFAQAFGAAIRDAGGEIRTDAEVEMFDIEGGRISGVTLTDGSRLACECVVSDIGIRNTLRRLPSIEVDYRWAREGFSLDTSVGVIGLYLGLEGDIAERGATSANEWFYDSWDVNQLWRDPGKEARAPGFFVSFPSLRDPSHEPGPRMRHTCEILAPVDWSIFAQWDRSNAPGGMHPGDVGATRSESYRAFKAKIEQQLLAQFGERFPTLVPCVRVIESSTPVSMATYTGAEHGAMAGLQTSPRRFLAQALRPRTPVRGLYLGGQDAATPGVVGAAMGGLMAAASIEPTLWKLLRQ